MLEIRITAPEISEAINNLAKALSCGSHGRIVCNQHGENSSCIDNVGTLNMDMSTPVAAEPQNPVLATVAPATPVVPTASTASTTPTTPTESTASTVPTAAPQYTLDMIAKAGTALIDAGKMGELTALLAKYGVEVLTALDPAYYGAFANELRNLGASI